MKSARNRKSCIASPLSVGTKERVTSSCPPDLTDSVKTALLQEIAEFDAKKVKQAKQDADTSAAGGPTLDAYQEWLAHNGGQEPIEANPDIVAEENGIKYLISKKDNKLVGLLTEFRQSLTPRELQVWNLVMKHQISHRKAATLLEIKDRVLETYLTRAKRKFRKFLEAIKRVEKE